MIPRRTVPPPALVLLAGAAACEPDAPARSAGFVVSDSQGVEVVTNAQPETGLALREVLRLGVVDGEPQYLFDNVRSITVDSAGGFWVADGAESVRHYGPDGRHTRSLGGHGNGPGESELYYSATPQGSHVLLFGAPGVLQLFGGDGSLLESTTPEGGTFAEPVGAVDGTWILRQRAYPEDSGTVFRRRVTFYRAQGLEGPRDTVRSFPGQLARVAGEEGLGRMIGRASWFHGNPAFGVDGGGRIVVSDTLRYRIEIHDDEGRLQRVLQRPADPRPFDAAWLTEMVSGFEEAQRNQTGSIDREWLARQMASATPDPAPVHLPFIEDLLVGPGGELWVERADRHPRPALRAVAHQYGLIRHAWLPGWAAPRVFDVFDGEGRYEGTLELPGDFAPMAVAGHRVYGVHYDELDVERIVVYEIEKV